MPSSTLRRRSLRAGSTVVLAASVLAGTQLGPSSAEALTTTTANLLTGDTALLQSSVGSWAGINAALSVPTPGVLAATAASTTNIVAEAGSGPTSWPSTVPGDIYTGTLSVQAPAAGTAVDASLVEVFYDGAGNRLDSASGVPTADTTGVWTPLRVVGIAPAGTAYIELAVIWYGATSGSVHELTQPTLTQTSGGSSALAGPLHTSGNKIYDVHGHVVVLRGVNRNGLMATVNPAGLTQYDIDRMKAWGANFVRVPLGEQLWLSKSCDYDPTYETAVDNVVHWITEDGMLAVLDLHWNFPGTTCGSYGQQPMADSAGAVTFWKQVAARYKGNALVAFDLYNEPNGISDSVWRNGGTVTNSAGVTYKAAGMSQLYSAVRGTGATNLVFMSGNAYGQDLPTTAPLSGTNIVYAIHAYTCGGSYCTANTSLYDPAPILDPWTTFATANPVMITEFGWPSGTDPSYLQNVISYAEARGWSWAVWEWDEGVGNPGGCTSSNWWSVLAECAQTTVYEPSTAGMPVLTGFEKN